MCDCASGGRDTGFNVDAKRSEAEIGKQGHIKRPVESLYSVRYFEIANNLPRDDTSTFEPTDVHSTPKIDKFYVFRVLYLKCVLLLKAVQIFNISIDCCRLVVITMK